MFAASSISYNQSLLTSPPWQHGHLAAVIHAIGVLLGPPLVKTQWGKLHRGVSNVWSQ